MDIKIVELKVGDELYCIKQVDNYSMCYETPETVVIMNDGLDKGDVVIYNHINCKYKVVSIIGPRNKLVVHVANIVDDNNIGYVVGDSIKGNRMLNDFFIPIHQHRKKVLDDYASRR